MTMLQSVFGSLQSMTSAQLLFGFVTCMCYAGLQGSLLIGRIRWTAASIGLSTAFGFVVAGPNWVYSVMLLAFAVAGLGLFAGVVWLLGSVLGFDGESPPRVLDSALAEPGMDAAPASSGVVGSRPLAASHWTAPSH